MTLEKLINDPDNADGLRKLKAQLATARRVVPFVGAGMSNAFGFPGWRKFLLLLAKQEGIEPEIEGLLNGGKFEAAAEKLIECYGDPDIFGDEIESHFGPHKIPSPFIPKPASTALVKLTNGSIVTTNYDKIIERTFEFHGIPISPVVGAPRSATKNALEGDARILLKIHGEATEITGRILTEQDYDLHYGIEEGQGYDPSKPLPKALGEIMSSTPLLFLGCSLENDRTLRVLNAITKVFPDRRHYAIVEKPKPEELVARRRHLRNHHIIPIWYDPVDHHRLLTELLLHLTDDLPDPIPKPKLPKGQLTGPTDERLQPNEPFEGRKDDIDAIQAWLASGKAVGNIYSTANIKGAPGIGKSRICHKVVSEYLAKDRKHQAFYISLQSASGIDGLWARIAEAYGWEDTEVDDFPNRMDAIGGLIYLDNLEDVLDDPKVKPILKRFAQFQNTKVLSSSRQALGAEVRNIPLGRLDDAAAIALFQEHWKHSGGGELVMTTELTAFIHKRLDNHALSIKLVASQAESYLEVAGLMEDWEKAAMAVGKTSATEPDKDESLEASISLSYHKILGRSAEAIQAWATIALFPEGMSGPAQAAIFPETWVGATLPPNILIHYSIVERRDGNKLYMLAPMQQFIFAHSPSQDETGAVNQSLENVFEYLHALAEAAKDKYFTQDHDRRAILDAMLDEFPTLGSYIQESQNLGGEWSNKTAMLYQPLHNLLKFNSLISHPILNKMVATFRAAHMTGMLANALESLGDLERRLGKVDSARALYEEAIGHYKTERDHLGLANALKSLGDLEIRLGRLDRARALYEESIGHYKTERDHLGLANALKSLGDLERHLGKVDRARALYEESIGHYKTERANLGLANALQSLGELESRLGRLDRARALYEEAIGHYKTERDHLGLANALLSLGDLEIRLGRLDRARALYEESIGHYKTERANLGLANALKSLGDLERHLGKVDRARALYEESIGHFKTVRDHLGLANALQSLGDLERILENNDNALAYYQQAIGLYHSVGDPMGLGYTLSEVARILNDKGQIEARDQAYLNALAAAHASHTPGVIAYVENIGKQWGAKL